jgi:hypothetical protein
MSLRRKILQKPIYQAAFTVWGAEIFFINTERLISVALQHLIQLHDYSLKFLNDAPWGAK